MTEADGTDSHQTGPEAPGYANSLERQDDQTQMLPSDESAAWEQRQRVQSNGNFPPDGGHPYAPSFPYGMVQQQQFYQQIPPHFMQVAAHSGQHSPFPPASPSVAPFTAFQPGQQAIPAFAHLPHSQVGYMGTPPQLHIGAPHGSHAPMGMMMGPPPNTPPGAHFQHHPGTMPHQQQMARPGQPMYPVYPMMTPQAAGNPSHSPRAGHASPVGIPPGGRRPSHGNGSHPRAPYTPQGNRQGGYSGDDSNYPHQNGTSTPSSAAGVSRDSSRADSTASSSTQGRNGTISSSATSQSVSGGRGPSGSHTHSQGAPGIYPGQQRQQQPISSQHLSPQAAASPGGGGARYGSSPLGSSGSNTNRGASGSYRPNHLNQPQIPFNPLPANATFSTSVLSRLPPIPDLPPKPTLGVADILPPAPWGLAGYAGKEGDLTETLRKHAYDLEALVAAYEEREQARLLQLEALAFNPTLAQKGLDAGEAFTEGAKTGDEAAPMPAPILGLRLLQRVHQLTEENDELGEMLAKRIEARSSEGQAGIQKLRTELAGELHSMLRLVSSDG